MVALPGQLFTNTQIPACIWLLTKDKSKRDGKRRRGGEVLFLDAPNVGHMLDRVLRAFTAEDIEKVAGTFHNCVGPVLVDTVWRQLKITSPKRPPPPLRWTTFFCSDS